MAKMNATAHAYAALWLLKAGYVSRAMTQTKLALGYANRAGDKRMASCLLAALSYGRRAACQR